MFRSLQGYPSGLPGNFISLLVKQLPNALKAAPRALQMLQLYVLHAKLEVIEYDHECLVKRLLDVLCFGHLHIQEHLLSALALDTHVRSAL